MKTLLFLFFITLCSRSNNASRSVDILRGVCKDCDGSKEVATISTSKRSIFPVGPLISIRKEDIGNSIGIGSSLYFGWTAARMLDQILRPTNNNTKAQVFRPIDISPDTDVDPKKLLNIIRKVYAVGVESFSEKTKKDLNLIINELHLLSSRLNGLGNKGRAANKASYSPQINFAQVQFDRDRVDHGVDLDLPCLKASLIDQSRIAGNLREQISRLIELETKSLSKDKSCEKASEREYAIEKLREMLLAVEVEMKRISKQSFELTSIVKPKFNSNLKKLESELEEKRLKSSELLAFRKKVLDEAEQARASVEMTETLLVQISTELNEVTRKSAELTAKKTQARADVEKARELLKFKDMSLARTEDDLKEQSKKV